MLRRFAGSDTARDAMKRQMQALNASPVERLVIVVAYATVMATTLESRAGSGRVFSQLSAEPLPRSKRARFLLYRFISIVHSFCFFGCVVKDRPEGKEKPPHFKARQLSFLCWPAWRFSWSMFNRIGLESKHDVVCWGKLRT